MKPIASDVNAFLNYCLNYSTAFLEVGGSTSRLERKIQDLSSAYELEIDIFSTPSAIFLSLQTDEQPITSIRRVQEDQIDLNKLKDLNDLINESINKTISISNAEVELNKIVQSKPLYPKLLLLLCAFLVGFFSSFSRFGNFKYATAAGGFSLIVTGVLSPFLHKYNFTRIYIIFFSLTITTLGIGLLSHFFNFPMETVLIGAVILLLPGFRITNAISELAEHNFISGTVKMAKAIIILLALGTSFMIAQETLEFFLETTINMNISEGIEIPFIQQFLCTLSIIACFSVTQNIPPKSIIVACFIGILGWLSFYLIHTDGGIYLSSFASTFFIGFFSLCFSRYFRVPSQLYSVPGIIALVPGLFAFILVYRASSKFHDTNTSTTVLVSLLIASLVFGLITARIPFQIHQNATPADD